jgi:Zn-dependent protease with chaperone function
VYLTTLYFLSQAGSQLVRWAAKPAVLALNAWARRAEITCDRASLLCTRELAASTETLVKLAVGSKRLYSDINIDEYMQQLDDVGSGPGRWQELFATHPYLPKRVQALRLFARTTFFRAGRGAQDEAPALTKDECDAQVALLLKVL